MTTITREQQKQILIDTANHVISRDNTSPYSENLRELARIALASLTAEPVAWTDAEELRDLRTFGFCEMFTVEPVSKDADMYRVIPLYTVSQPVPERERIRREHAEWSDATFGDVGPVGPLKHLSKEALEAAAEPDDLSEWADMQFLLWDAQRRAGVTDEQITMAMVEKLAINKARQWPEPKDGEPRLHIKEQLIATAKEEIAPPSLTAKPVAFINGAGEPVLYGAYIGIAVGTHLYTTPPAPVVPEKLPCSVELKPGLIIGKGCKTETLLTALRRRAEYYAKLEAMTPEEREKHGASIEAFKAMLPQPAPVAPEECPAELPYAQVKAAADLYALCWQSGEVVTYTPDPEKATIWLNNYSGTCVQEYVKLERLQEALAGNSPVIPGGWISCSERMPDREYVLAGDFSGTHYLASIPNVQVGIYADWFDDEKPCWDDGDGNDLHLKEVTHWMPLPEPPQEVK